MYVQGRVSGSEVERARSKEEKCPAISLELSNDASHAVPEREDKIKIKAGKWRRKIVCVYYSVIRGLHFHGRCTSESSIKKGKLGKNGTNRNGYQNHCKILIGYIENITGCAEI